MIPEVKRRLRTLFVPRGGGVLDIPVAGHKDPRGPDNNIYVWIDDERLLHIRVFKANRCYRFLRVEETEGYVEVIAK